VFNYKNYLYRLPKLFVWISPESLSNNVELLPFAVDDDFGEFDNFIRSVSCFVRQTILAGSPASQFFNSATLHGDQKEWPNPMIP
jgi:hypothetical protein